MTIMQDAEQRFAAQASLYTRRAYQAALNSGQTVVEIVDGNLVETFPDGSARVLKEAPPKHKVSIGTHLKVT
ncbi:hypothetical protein [Vreelandella zhanjiangensis]|uniref:hypothetical protein n=1 Tax=Vreelandella zhanjiangensis TaxID=1121960 RepID=UPI000371E202|nr:hypothetical protein [Halomonas zhanjiangensis]